MKKETVNSKEWIAESLFKIMERKKYNGISITEIAEKAGVDRRTFYRHFKSKEDVITYKIRELSKEYEKVLLSKKSFKTQATLLSFFQICEKQKHILLCLYKNELLPLLLKDFEKFGHILHLKYTDINELEKSENIKYVLAYHLGGLWNVLNKWLSEGSNKTPQELTMILSSILPESI